MAIETMRNRVTGKTAKVLVKVNEKGLRYITARQYNRALASLGHGPIESSAAFLVYTEDGREYAAVERLS